MTWCALISQAVVDSRDGHSHKQTSWAIPPDGAKPMSDAVSALHHRVWLLRQSSGNSAKRPLLWPVLNAQPNQRGTNIGVIRRCASVSLRTVNPPSLRVRGPARAIRSDRTEIARYINKSVHGEPFRRWSALASHRRYKPACPILVSRAIRDSGNRAAPREFWDFVSVSNFAGATVRPVRCTI
jgi:hypothetical protein